jgi:selenocysteine lyase/cysteine desulfurase
MAAAAEQTNDIRKYEEIGTHPAANHNAIAVALAFHRAIGVDRKIARLRQLRDRWAKRLLAASDRVRMLTPIGPNESGAIGVVAVEGMDIGKLQAWLLTKHHIVATPLIHPEFSGLRVTPNVYTTLDEVDLFADRMEQAIRRGVA